MGSSLQSESSPFRPGRSSSRCWLLCLPDVRHSARHACPSLVKHLLCARYGARSCVRHAGAESSGEGNSSVVVVVPTLQMGRVFVFCFFLRHIDVNKDKGK